MRRYVFPAVVLLGIGVVYFFLATLDFGIHQGDMENRRALGCLDTEECGVYSTPVYFNLGIEKVIIGAILVSAGMSAFILNRYHSRLHTLYGRH